MPSVFCRLGCGLARKPEKRADRPERQYLSQSRASCCACNDFPSFAVPPDRRFSRRGVAWPARKRAIDFVWVTPEGFRLCGKPLVVVAHAVPRATSSTSVRSSDEGNEDEGNARRSEEHTSELQSLMRISYAGFCLKKKTHK